MATSKRLTELSRFYMKVYQVADFFTRDLTPESLERLGLEDDLIEDLMSICKHEQETCDTLLDVLGELIAEEREWLEYKNQPLTESRQRFLPTSD